MLNIWKRIGFQGEQQFQALSDYLRKKYADLPPDVVVAHSEASLNFLLKNSKDLFPNVPIVFYVASRPNHEALAVKRNLTGVVIYGSYKKNVDLALTLQPETKQVFVISGTLDHEKVFEEMARDDLEGYEGKLQINYLTNLSPTDLVAKTKSLPQQSIVLFAWQQSRDEKGKLWEYSDLLDLIVQTTPAPVYTMSGSQIGRGPIGGYVYTPETSAAKVASIVRRILGGERAEDIPVEGAPTRPVFDWRELRRWKISEDSLPPGSVVSFREFTYWQLYKSRIIGIAVLVALQSLLIMFLLIERRRRRLATEARRHLADIVETSDDAIISKDLEGEIMSWNRGAEKIYGYSAEEMIGQSISKLVPADKQKELSTILAKVKAGENVDHLETVRLNKEGHQIDVSLLVSTLKDERGKIIGASSIARDITDRKQAGEALLQSETRFRNMADSAPVMIWMAGPDKRGTYVNQQWLDFTGTTAEQDIANTLGKASSSR
jgi:PAS domain S-box-containing protein